MTSVDEKTPLIERSLSKNNEFTNSEKEDEFNEEKTSSADDFSNKPRHLAPRRGRGRNIAIEPLFDTNIEVYKRRWYILFLFSVISFLQSYFCNTWTVIAVSVHAAFGWSMSTISLMQNWYAFMYLATIFPFAWLIGAKGLRPAMLITSLALFIATVLRCISMTPPAVTWLNNLGDCLIGVAMPVSYIGGPIISAVWFPPKERSTCTSIGVVIGSFGYAVCFIYGPMFVSEPTISKPSVNSTQITYTNLSEIREEIFILRLIECVITGITTIATFVYFPSKPPKPPSPSAGLPKIKVIQGIKALLKTADINFWLVCFVFAISDGVESTWMSLLAVDLRRYMPQRQIGYLGFLANTCGMLAAVSFGRVCDFYLGKTKHITVLLMFGSVFATFWVVLLTMDYIAFSVVQIFVAVTVQTSLVTGAWGLYYELAIENNYPVDEIVTSSFMTIIYNLFPIMFLLLFLIPNIGTAWINWFLYGSFLVCLPLLLSFKERYRRLAMDRRNSLITTVGDIGEPFPRPLLNSP